MPAGVTSKGGAEVFAGVRFVLFGFDSVSEKQYRAELVRKGGVDVGRYDGSCTHVIVSGRVYDDPVCVAARNDGKTVVTELWIEDSVDFAALVDPNKILYRPVRDLNGIPGSESFFICLTGYQRQERDNIMKMVGMMGAHFSKPLIAAKVTHLICYKFEGEKYELARRVNIKLVNHRWLEDCLNAWEILPIDDYKKSGWELEIMEAEARDSDEETEEDSSVKQLAQRRITGETSYFPRTTPMSKGPNPSGPVVETFTSEQEVTVPTKMPSHHFEEILTANHLFSTPCKGSGSDRASCMFNNFKVLGEFSNHDGMGNSENALKEGSHQDAPVISANIINLNIDSNKLTLDAGSNISNHSDAAEDKYSSPGYSRKKTGGSVSTNDVLERIGSFDGNLLVNDVSVFAPKQDASKFLSAAIQSHAPSAGMHHTEGAGSALPQKEKVAVPSFRFISPDSGFESLKPYALENSLTVSTSAKLDSPLKNDTPKGKPDSPFDNAKNPSHGITESLMTNQDRHSSKSKPNTFTKKFVKRSSTSRANASCSFDGQVSDLFCNAGQMEEPCSTSPEKRKASVPSFCSRSPESGFENLKPSVPEDSLAASTSVQQERHLDNDTTQGKPECPSDVKNSSNGTIPASPMANQDRSSSKLKSTALRKKFVKCHVASRAKDIACSDGQVAELFSNAESTRTQDGQRSIEALPDLGTPGSDSILSSIGCKRANLDHDCNLVKPTDSKMSLSKNMNHLSAPTTDSEHADAMSPKCKIPKAPPPRAAEVSLQQDKGDVPVTELSNIQRGTRENEKLKDETMSSCGSKDSGLKILSNNANSFSFNSSAKILFKKAVAKKMLSRKPKSSAENGNQRMTASCNESVNPDIFSLEPEKVLKAQLEQKASDENNEMDATVSKDEVMMGFGAKGQNSGGESPSRLEKVKEPILMETVDGKENEMEQSVSVNVVMRQKVKKARHLVNSSSTKHVATSAIQMSKDADKENKPEESVLVPVKSDKHGCVDMTVKYGGKLGQRSKRIHETPNSEQQSHRHQKAIPELAWFMLSGHRLQRKEFRLIIRRLRGRLCSDSHHWSFKTTHFMVPEPVRRTEKFFAAAASGRWILKTDYLTSSNEAGKFLEEEPFEWHGSGFTEDGAINLEAPRRWRLLRERTGHGAFYGMQIIIYGESVAPSTDTLKRVVKAGDGTILATSPPYTRFLKSGVDFAIIGPNTPHVDSWIQEFLRHQIPCVLADYLVEYVCKPGCSLNKHVLYQTHAWAEKSFANLLSRSEEVVTMGDSRTPSEDSDDLRCSVCGSRDRGEVMLICGDEEGSTGCGIGTHIDCCDPPLDAVPEDDWFCPKCSERRVRKAPAKGRRKK
uniref:BRCT domain-containing protein At4g02110 n=1 Tax=Anthurium amnicola TaxID=1678845 RepID=A0A1D1YQN3_9ARAE